MHYLELMSAPTAPHEDSPLICKDGVQKQLPLLVPMGLGTESCHDTKNTDLVNQIPSSGRTIFGRIVIVALSSLAVIVGKRAVGGTGVKAGSLVPVGPYRLVEAQEGPRFFSFYDFFNGHDSIGSAGYNMYVSQPRAEELGIASIITEEDSINGVNEEFIYMSSAPTQNGPRDSVRLEGKKRFDRGLFILDVRHMPDGCGVWPAWWLTDEANWPMNGEIDVLEGTYVLLSFLRRCFSLVNSIANLFFRVNQFFQGVNGQTTAKTALHTSNQCDMYAHVAPYAKTGHWEWISEFCSPVFCYCVFVTWYKLLIFFLLPQPVFQTISRVSLIFIL